MALTARAVETAKPRDKLYKLSDGAGLQLWVMPTGSRLWRLAYRFEGKQKLLALGAFPAVSLAMARQRRVTHRKVLEAGRDPQVERQTLAGNTFDVIADEYLARMQKNGRAESTIQKNAWLLAFARSTLGLRPIASITSGDVLAVLRGIEQRGKLESARRARAVIGSVFEYAMLQEKAEKDPTALLRRALEPPRVQHRAALLDPGAFGGLLRAIEGMERQPVTRAALTLCSLLAPRPGELRLAEWTEFDFTDAIWSIPAGRMKMRRPHASPLSPQALAVLHELHQLTGQGRYLFPSFRAEDRPISDGTMIAALRRLGFTKADVSPHGFRASFSSLANESGKWHRDAIERQLAHGDDDAIRGAYARSPFWAERVRLMAWWGDECDRMRGAQVIPFRREA